MEKWADYLISHVKKDKDGEITHVLLHRDNGDTISAIGIKTEAEIINIIKNGYSVKTILWGYPNWNKGAIVEVVRGTYKEFIRTNRDKTEKDNLDNLIPLNNQ